MSFPISLGNPRLKAPPTLHARPPVRPADTRGPFDGVARAGVRRRSGEGIAPSRHRVNVTRCV